ncbi:MAG TPA: hypothetical protein VIG99_26290 [Myxococcaceae bacterium]
MLVPTVVKPLLMEAPSGPGRPAHVAAASGVVRMGRFLYVVADDEVQLAVFEEGAPRGRWAPLFDGALPAETEARRAAKPDLEVLARLPPRPAWEHGALVALPSGSAAPRRFGALAPLDPSGGLAGPCWRFDLQALFEQIAAELGTVLNVEGAALLQDRFVLLHRGAGRMRSALVEVDLERLVEAVSARGAVSANSVRDVREVELPEVSGWPLALTDGLALPDGSIAFTAVAEQTVDPVKDAPCAGSAVGRISRQGKVLKLETLQGAPKVEGITLQGEKAWLVTDQDDPSVPAQLLSVPLP